VNVDYAKLQATGEAVKAALAAGKEAHITSPTEPTCGADRGAPDLR